MRPPWSVTQSGGEGDKSSVNKQLMYKLAGNMDVDFMHKHELLLNILVLSFYRFYNKELLLE